MFRGGTGEILKLDGDAERRLMTALDRTRLTDKTAKNGNLKSRLPFFTVAHRKTNIASLITQNRKRLNDGIS
jgi:hypothetical protein